MSHGTSMRGIAGGDDDDDCAQDTLGKDQVPQHSVGTCWVRINHHRKRWVMISEQIDKYGGKDEHNVAWLPLAKHLDPAKDPFLQPETF
ncbi:unnamed protein product [Lota lota]